MTMELLRNKGRTTRMLILLRAVLDAPRDQKSLSGPMGITPQAASLYLRTMEDEGLIERTKKGPKATMKGVEMLHRELLTLKEFVDTSIMGLDIVRSTDAVARGRIHKGDRCALFMEDGMLFAQSGREGPSTGISDMDAEDGCMVPISGLSGVMELRTGSVWLMKITPARSGGGSFLVKVTDLPGAKGRKLSSGMRIAALDMEALALIRRSGLRCDSELPLPEDVRAMLLRGLDVMAFGTPHSLSGLRSALGGLPQRMEEVDIGPGKREDGPS